MPRTPRCVYCPVATKKTRYDTLRQPLLQEEEAVWHGSVPRYDGRNSNYLWPVRPMSAWPNYDGPLLPVHIQWAVRQSEPLPEEIRALLAILRVLLTPRPDERIKTSADIAALLMVLMGLLDYEEMWEVVRRFGVCEIAPQEQKVESS